MKDVGSHHSCEFIGSFALPKFGRVAKLCFFKVVNRRVHCSIKYA